MTLGRMETRILVAYALIIVMAAALVGFAVYARRKCQAHRRRMRGSRSYPISPITNRTV